MNEFPLRIYCVNVIVSTEILMKQTRLVGMEKDDIEDRGDSIQNAITAVFGRSGI